MMMKKVPLGAVAHFALYYFAGNAQPGERNDDGSDGVWHAVPAAARY